MGVCEKSIFLEIGHIVQHSLCELEDLSRLSRHSCQYKQTNWGVTVRL